MNTHHTLNYLEFPACDLVATRQFFEAVFGWSFQNYGPDYIAFSDRNLDGGFYQAPRGVCSRSAQGAALAVFYSDDLEASLAAVERAGGQVLKTIFEFPGGRRFHFAEPSGNEFAVWGLKSGVDEIKAEG